MENKNNARVGQGGDLLQVGRREALGAIEMSHSLITVVVIYVFIFLKLKQST